MQRDIVSPSLNERLQEIVDYHDITKLLNTYCRGCDRVDKDRMASVYAKQSWDDHGDHKCSGEEFVELTIDALAKTTNTCSHQLGQSLINVTGDEAGAETYFIAVVRTPTDAGGESLNLLGGRYVDTLLREEGGWRIKTRVVARDWSITQPITSDWLAAAKFVQGQRSNLDPSFAALQIEHSAGAGG